MTCNSLLAARIVDRPTREAMLERAPSVQQFWMQKQILFEDAWTQWEESESKQLNSLDSSLYDAELQTAVDRSDDLYDVSNSARLRISSSLPNSCTSATVCLRAKVRGPVNTTVGADF